MISDVFSIISGHFFFGPKGNSKDLRQLKIVEMALCLDQAAPKTGSNTGDHLALRKRNCFLSDCSEGPYSLPVQKQTARGEGGPNSGM